MRSTSMDLVLDNKLESAVSDALQEAERAQVVTRIWSKDASLWKAEPEQQQVIRKSLDWLTVASEMNSAVDELLQFAREIQAASFKHVMVCGMGGSSLCPEVLVRTFGSQADFPELLVLDSTDPDAIATFASRIDIERCLFVISSKSGTTTEPLVFYKYWYDQVAKRKSNPGGSFVVITDPGTPLIHEAKSKGFRRVFLNQPHIGGRYSALSYFGIVPAALMGLKVGELLRRAVEMSAKCGRDKPITENPGAVLGAMIAECAKAKRDKLTLVTDPRLAKLGLWIEQLLAESTGKEGKGILPVDGEPLGDAKSYFSDRAFVATSLGEQEVGIVSQLNELVLAGHPVVYRTLGDPYDLGAEFFLWEFATAFAGWRMGINPFDQPNVQESKDATRNLLQWFNDKGVLPEQLPHVSDGVLTIYVPEHMRTMLPASTVSDTLRAHLASARSGDYFAFLVYVEETPAVDAALLAVRTLLRDKTRCATTSGYGPRFLHSTGQLHKGGPDTGVFIQVTAPDGRDLPVPGETYSFSILKQAQALGDLQALSSRRRRAIRVDLGKDLAAGLARLEKLIAETI
jgi:glucose-6-phosphate isomerase